MNFYQLDEYEYFECLGKKYIKMYLSHLLYIDNTLERNAICLSGPNIGWPSHIDSNSMVTRIDLI